MKATWLLTQMLKLALCNMIENISVTDMNVIVIVFIMLKSSGSTLCVIQFAIIVFLPLQNCYLLTCFPVHPPDSVQREKKNPTGL